MVYVHLVQKCPLPSIVVLDLSRGWPTATMRWWCSPSTWQGTSATSLPPTPSRSVSLLPGLHLGLFSSLVSWRHKPCRSAHAWAGNKGGRQSLSVATVVRRRVVQVQQSGGGVSSTVWIIVGAAGGALALLVSPHSCKLSAAGRDAVLARTEGEHEAAMHSPPPQVAIFLFIWCRKRRRPQPSAAQPPRPVPVPVPTNGYPAGAYTNGTYSNGYSGAAGAWGYSGYPAAAPPPPG